MEALAWITETRIREAIARGDLNELPGKGHPVAIPDLSRVPEELRACYILLETHGLLPPELASRKEYLSLRELLAACGDDVAAPELRARLRRARLRLELASGGRCDTPAFGEYADALTRRFDTHA
jgi:hypothetical protein